MKVSHGNAQLFINGKRLIQLSLSFTLTCAHDELVNDDEKVIEDEIAFFTALISYSTFYGSISFHFCRMT